MPKQTLAPITLEDIQDIVTLQQNLDQTATTYRDAGKKTMLAVVIDLMNYTAKSLTRMQARYNRENVTSHRKAHKQLKGQYVATPDQQS